MAVSTVFPHAPPISLYQIISGDAPWPGKVCSCGVLRGASSQAVVSVCEHTPVGLMEARLFIGWQLSSEKLLS